MLTRKWSLLLLAPTLLCLRTGAAAEPEAFMAPDGKFSINFAVKPMTMEQKSPTGPVKMYLAIAGTNGQIVVVTDNPVLAKATPESIEMLMDQSRDGFAGKGKVIAEKKVKLNDKYPGRDVIVSGDQGFMHLRMFVVDTSVFVVMVTGQTEEVVKNKENTAFLDSFKLGKK